MIIDERNSYSKKTILDNECEYQLIQLKHSIDTRNLEKSIKIAIELHCSGKFKELWKIIITFIIKQIHIIDDRLIKKLYIKYSRFNDAKKQIHQKIALRNINILRKDLIELIGYITLLPKRDIYQYIPSHYYYHEYNQNNSLLSYNKLSNYEKYHIKEVINNTNVKEGMMNAIKEIEYQIRLKKESKVYDTRESMDKLFYWIGFVLSYKPGNQDYNQFLNNDMKELKKISKNKYIWIVWNILLKYSKNKPFYKTICFLYQMFSEKTNENTHLYLVIACMLFYMELKLNSKKRKKINNEVQEYILKVDELYDEIQEYIDKKRKDKEEKRKEKEKKKKEREKKRKQKEEKNRKIQELKKEKGGDNLFQGIIGILPSKDDTYEYQMFKKRIKEKLKKNMNNNNLNIQSEINQDTNEKIISVKVRNNKKKNKKKIIVEKEF